MQGHRQTGTAVYRQEVSLTLKVHHAHHAVCIQPELADEDKR